MLRYNNSIHWWYNKYIHEIKLTTEKNVYKRYYATLLRFFQRHRDKHLANEFHRWDIDDYVEDRLAEGRAGGTVGVELSIIRTFWRWLMDRGLADYNPAARKKGTTTENPKRITGVPRAQIRQLLQACNTPRDKLVILLPLVCGLNRQEFARLKIVDIDWDNNQLYIQGKVARTVPMRDDIKKLISEAIDRRKKYAFTWGGGTEMPKYWLEAINRRAEIFPAITHKRLRKAFLNMLMLRGLIESEICTEALEKFQEYLPHEEF